MSRSAVQTPVRPQSKAAHGVTSHRRDAVQNTAFAENSRFSQTAPPGFAAAAAAAAVAAADVGAHTATPWSAAAAAEIAAARAGTRPAIPWPSAAANAGNAADTNAQPSNTMANVCYPAVHTAHYRGKQ